MKDFAGTLLADHCQTGIVLRTWYSDTDGSSVSNIKVFNNTFYGNAEGLVVRPMVSATVSWENNLFAGNGATYVNSLAWDPGSADYNVYFGGGAGPGAHSLTSDPMITNAAAGDFTISASSPAINAGDPSSTVATCGAVDFAGNARIQGGEIDIGAFEVR